MKNFKKRLLQHRHYDNGCFIEERVIGRHRGETSLFDREQVTFMDVSPKQIVSVATATIPFLEHDDASRALMGANMQRQAVPLVKPESPIVGTGIEYRAAKDSGSVVVAENDGFVTYADSRKIVVTAHPDAPVKVGTITIYDDQKDYDFEAALKLYEYGLGVDKVYHLTTFARSNQYSNIMQKTTC